MDFIKTLTIAASGLRAQAGRMRVISENIANADSTPQSAGADPYRRKIPTFRSELDRAAPAPPGVFEYRASQAIPPPTPMATLNTPTSIHWWK